MTVYCLQLQKIPNRGSRYYTKKKSPKSPDADYLGQLKSQGENDADQEVVYAKITGKIQDAPDNSRRWYYRVC